MGRRYNIINKIANAKERATVQIDDEHEFKINDSYPAAMMIKATMEDKKLSDEKKIEKVLGTAFKKDEIEHIASLNLGTSGYMAIINTILAAISDMDLEEIEELEKQHKEQTPSR